VESYNVILADDHAMFRRGIKRIIEEIPDVAVVGEASDGFELLNLLKKATPHLVILDISMPNLRGIEATKEIKMIHPGVKVLILTMHKDREYLYHALSAGAEGYLLKEDADTELMSAISTIRKGKTYLSPLISVQLQDLLVQEYQGTGSQSLIEPLTTREKEIIKLIAEGKSSREIADMLFISNRTVQHHRANVMRKLNLRKTADLVKYAILKGYV
jgi:DNA-binding NarL/FixJ family response regulator